jgi:hypothetical protein
MWNILSKVFGNTTTSKRKEDGGREEEKGDKEGQKKEEQEEKKEEASASASAATTSPEGERVAAKIKRKQKQSPKKRAVVLPVDSGKKSRKKSPGGERPAKRPKLDSTETTKSSRKLDSAETTKSSRKEPSQKEPSKKEKEASRKEAVKKEAAKKEASKKEAAKREASKKEAAKKEAAKKEAAKKEAAKTEAAKKEASAKKPPQQEQRKNDDNTKLNTKPGPPEITASPPPSGKPAADTETQTASAPPDVDTNSAEKPTKARNTKLRTEEEKKARLIQNIQEQVICAGTLVAQALYGGPWPSPPPEDGGSRSAHHQSHMSMVGASVQQFCRDTALPSMLQAALDQPDVKLPFGKSPLVGTCIMLREVLVQNSKAIFGLPNIPEKHAFGARVLATAVVLQALDHDAVMTRRKFLEAIRAYDAGDASFGNHLVYDLDPTDPAQESFQRHARRHPMRGRNRLAVPEVNAVHVTVLQNATESS